MLRTGGEATFEKLPLVVDLDGTLCKADTLAEALVSLVLSNPSQAPGLLGAWSRGPAQLKHFLARAECYDVRQAPLRYDLLDYVKQQAAKGRDLHLVTSAPQSVADQISARLGVFKTAHGSSSDLDLKGEHKLSVIRQLLPGGFVYAGNDPVVSRSADGIIATEPASDKQATAPQPTPPVEARIPGSARSVRAWLKAVRIHQWTKNLLMFVPLMLAHLYADPTAVLKVTLGFIATGLVASATYLLNDLSDLAADRHHLTKRNRPLASGLIGAERALAVSVGLGLAGMIGATLLSGWFAVTLAGYVALTAAYSLRLKAIALLDVFVLGLLFTMRVLMGIAILGVVTSPWLLIFSIFFFLSLSMAKRHVEIVQAVKRGETGRIKGRGYLAGDAPLTLALGVSSSLAAVTLLFLYVVNDAYPHAYYRHPEWLFAIGLFVFLWTCRIWLMSHRGELDDDPVVFALKDPASWLIGAAMAVVFVLATL